MKPTVSIVVPALNEEQNLDSAVKTIMEAVGDRGEGLQVIILDDGSTDRTGLIADALARQDPRITVVHNPRNMGLGYNYWRGVELAAHEYVLMIPGDNETPSETIRAIVDSAGQTDLVITYVTNTQVRPMSRRVVSRLFVWLVNTMFGLRVRYYNGNCIIRRDVLATVPHNTTSHAYMATTLVRLLKRGSTYQEMPVQLQRRGSGGSKAFRPKNVALVASALLSLFWEVQVVRRFGRKPQRRERQR